MSETLSPVSAPPVTEKSLADSWRVTVRQLGNVRREKLREGYHWNLVNQTVMYTQEGVEKLRELIDNRIEAGEVVPKPPPESMQFKIHRWKVVRIPPNPRLVLLENCWSAETLWLYVIRHQNFRRNMIVQESDISPPDALGHRHLARKLPRFHGRW